MARRALGRHLAQGSPGHRLGPASAVRLSVRLLCQALCIRPYRHQPASMPLTLFPSLSMSISFSALLSGSFLLPFVSVCPLFRLSSLRPLSTISPSSRSTKLNLEKRAGPGGPCAAQPCWLFSSGMLVSGQPVTRALGPFGGKQWVAVKKKVGNNEEEKDPNRSASRCLFPLGRKCAWNAWV